MRKSLSILTLLAMITFCSLTGFVNLGWAEEPAVTSPPTAISVPATTAPQITSPKPPEENPWEEGFRHHGHHPEHVLVPIAFFIFLLIMILGSRGFRERTEQRRLEVLKLMLEKGQTVPESVMQNVFDGGNPWSRHGRYGRHTARRGFAATFVGIGLLAYAFFDNSSDQDHHGFMIAGIILLGIGLGNLVARRFDRSDVPPSSAKKLD